MADELMLYQMLVAAWPIGLTAEDSDGINAFADRLSGWFEKSMREAKRHSEWAAPNEAYEAAAQKFLRDTLDPTRPVLAEIIGFAERIGAAGAINGLAQTLLRFTVPGVPDLYQGAEFWDQSLVDPDNRRPVDFPARQRALAAGRTPAKLLGDWRTGEVKQAIIARALNLRAQQPDLFARGNYLRLEAAGECAGHIIAFTREFEGQKIMVAVTRLAASFTAGTPLVPHVAWRDTALALPPGAWTDMLTGARFGAGNLAAPNLFAALPVALLSSS